MLNGEKYKDEIIKDITISDDGLCYIVFTKYMGFSDKDFVQTDGKIIENVVFNWLLSEYKEPIKLSRLEYEVLKWLKDKNYRYITRDNTGDVVDNPILYAYIEKPKRDMTGDMWIRGGTPQSLYLFRDLFQFVKWKDEEPTLIQDILNNCEIIKED